MSIELSKADSKAIFIKNYRNMWFADVNPGQFVMAMSEVFQIVFQSFVALTKR